MGGRYVVVTLLQAGTGGRLVASKVSSRLGLGRSMSRDRRGRTIQVVSLIALAFTFAAIKIYVDDVRSQVGDLVPVLSVTVDVPAFASIAPDEVEVVEIPEKWTSGTELKDVAAISEFVAAQELTAGTVLREGTVAALPAVDPGQREIAILVSAETGVAGKVKPGSVVDIFATFDRGDAAAACATIVVPRADVTDVGGEQTRTSEEEGAFAVEDVIPVTFALDPFQTRKLVYAESFATEVRLALVSPTEPPDAPLDDTLVECLEPRGVRPVGTRP